MFKVFKILLKFQKCRKKLEKAFCFLDNCSWIDCVNLSLWRGENLWLGVNMFRNSPNIFHITKRDFFRFNCLHIDQFCACLPGCFSKGVHNWDFLDISLTTVFRLRNFENTSAMRVIFFLKILKILSTFQKCQKLDEKNFSLLEIIASKLATWNCLY